MRCTHCGREVLDDALNCVNCGAAIARKPEDGSVDQRVLDIVKSRGKIDAIKYYREQTKCGLKEAKDAVESMMLRAGVEMPKSGCAGVLLLGVTLLGSAGWWWLRSW